MPDGGQTYLVRSLNKFTRQRRSWSPFRRGSYWASSNFTSNRESLLIEAWSKVKVGLTLSRRKLVLERMYMLIS